jgi:hypothetical protein
MIGVMVSDLSQKIDLKHEAADEEVEKHRLFPHLSPSILDVSCDSDAEKYMFQEPTRIGVQFESRHAKKRRVPSACIPCKLSRAKCSDTRPCSRCITTSKSNDCIDGPLYSKVCLPPSPKIPRDSDIPRESDISHTRSPPFDRSLILHRPVAPCSLPTH